MFYLIILQPDRLSKFERSFIDQVVIDAKKCVNIWRALSGGTAEIENVKNCSICDIFNVYKMIAP